MVTTEQGRAAAQRVSADINAGFRRMFEGDPELQRALDRMGVGRDPRMQQWQAEDGWLVGYSTERMGDGKFAAFAYRPTGPGARTGRARSAVKVYERHYATRKAAKARAVALYRQHSSRWAARHPAS